MRIAVIGAAGMIGSAVTDWLRERPGLEVVPVVHSLGNAWPLLRHGLALRQADLADAGQTAAAVAGCTHVVNCSMSEWPQLVPHLDHLLTACREAKVGRLVHLSSVTVYGEPPAPAAAHEDAPPAARPGTYGHYKAQQDELVLAAHRAGLPSVVLCLPHVVGPGARLLLNLIGAIPRRRWVLVEGGRNVCNVVDVANVCRAVELALQCAEPDGRRTFIVNDDCGSWRELAAALAPFTGVASEQLPDLTVAELAALRPRDLSLPEAARASLELAEVKQLVRRTKLVRNRAVYRALTRLNRWRRGQRPPPVETPRLPGPPPLALSEDDLAQCRQQLRAVVHQVDKARRQLGYQQVVSWRASLDRFRRWYAAMTGFDSAYWPLFAELQR